MAEVVANKVTLSYNMSLAEKLKACEPVAKVDLIAAEMLTEEYFPVNGSGEVLMPSLKRVVEISFKTGAAQALVWIKENGLRPATLPELLQFAVNNPEEVTEHAIVALSPVIITPRGRFKGWHGECRRPFVPTIINRTRFHDGSRLVRKGQPEIWLSQGFDHRTSVDWHLAVLPQWA